MLCFLCFFQISFELVYWQQPDLFKSFQVLSRLHQRKVIDINVAQDIKCFIFEGYWYGASTCM